MPDGEVFGVDGFCGLSFVVYDGIPRIVGQTTAGNEDAAIFKGNGGACIAVGCQRPNLDSIGWFDVRLNVEDYGTTLIFCDGEPGLPVGREDDR